MKQKVLLGMSGGVDSSVAALLLKQAGYEVIGATMILWKGNYQTTIEDAKKVCEKLNIKHIILDCQKEFQEHVINNFIQCYQCATTPNPCVECNQFLKFGMFYEKAKELGCEFIATGHYAKIQWNEKYNQYVLTKSESEKKDQSYFLYSIPNKILGRVLFPLSDFTDKTEIRKLAEENGLTVAKKKDSQEVCFIPDNDYAKFLQENGTKTKQGNIVLQDGTILGSHQGLIHYTVGQRKGMGVSYPEPLYVLKLDTSKNEVIVGIEEQLYSKELEANCLNFLITSIDFTKPIEVMAKIRYRSLAAKAILKIENVNEKEKVAKVIFEKEQRAITPGQSVVFYLDDIVLGGGKII